MYSINTSIFMPQRSSCVTVSRTTQEKQGVVKVDSRYCTVKASRFMSEGKLRMDRKNKKTREA